MTPLDLVQCLKAYCEECTQDMPLTARVEKNTEERAERPPKVFIGSLPDKEAEKREAPYILLKLLTTKDEDGESRAMVRIIIVTYSLDKQDNYIQCLNVLSKIKTKLLEDVVIAERYSCQKPIDALMYDDDLEVYQIGEIMTTWEMPEVKRDITKFIK